MVPFKSAKNNVKLVLRPILAAIFDWRYIFFFPWFNSIKSCFLVKRQCYSLPFCQNKMIMTFFFIKREHFVFIVKRPENTVGS